MLVKMEGFITDAGCSCTGRTFVTDISQETPVSRYSLKQNDRSCAIRVQVSPQLQQNYAIIIMTHSMPTESCDNLYINCCDYCFI